MRGLTLTRPWDHALLNGKLVENRPTRPPTALIGERIALHAGLKYDYEALAFIKRTLGVSQIPQREGGIIFATTVIVGYVERGTQACARAGVDVLLSAPGLEWALTDRWFFGPVGIVLRDTWPLAKPVTCRGMQGWFPIPADVEARVRAQLGEAA
jgi:hypothetical protein